MPAGIKIYASFTIALGVAVVGDRVVVEAPDLGPVQAVIDALRASGLQVRRVAEIRQSLEDLFLAAVGDAAPGADLGGKEGGR